MLSPRPSELFLETDINRLLNVAELANKYCFSSLEAWITERIHILVQDPTGPLCSATPAVYGQILDIAVLCGHQKLQTLVTQHLISRILWYNTRPEAVVGIAEKHSLQTLLGVCYYRQLVRMERAQQKADAKIHGTQPHDMDTEAGMRSLSAHRSLLSLWEQIRATPPTFHSGGCPCHDECEARWQDMWFEAGQVDEAFRSGSIDILGRLKCVMLGLRKSLSDASFISMQCKLAALEAITDIRDEMIEGLVTHFMEVS